MAKRHFLILGGCGFIGSNLVHLLHQHCPDSQITVFDLLTYAGSLDNLAPLTDSNQLTFLKGDLAEMTDLARLTGRYDLAVNFAAETHVDRSFYDTTGFVRSNVLGVVNLLVWCREHEVPLLQISTDEVYGPAAPGQTFDEEAPLQPSSPYAASKAAADLMVQTAIKTFDQKAAIVRTCNNYGPHQYPEKLIPLCIDRALQGLPLPIYGDGKQQRCWLHVEDFCTALLPLLDSFPTSEVINIGSVSEIENLSVVRKIIEHLQSTSRIDFVADRPGHDPAYRIDSGKYTKTYGAIESRPLADGLRQTIDWYLGHRQIFERLGDEETISFFERHYEKPE
jgi:dTDP-glucose 4,6-dehydratase